MLLLGCIILTAITGVLTPALSIPLAAGAVLLLGCVKVTDTYKSVEWPAVATVGGMISLASRWRRQAPRELWRTQSSTIFNGLARISFLAPC